MQRYYLDLQYTNIHLLFVFCECISIAIVFLFCKTKNEWKKRSGNLYGKSVFIINLQKTKKKRFWLGSVLPKNMHFSRWNNENCETMQQKQWKCKQAKCLSILLLPIKSFSSLFRTEMEVGRENVRSVFHSFSLHGLCVCLCSSDFASIQFYLIPAGMQF